MSAHGRFALAAVATIALIASILLPSSASASASSAAGQVAARATVVDAGIVKSTLVGFDRENIISDALFYDGAAMTAAEIQSFLDQKVGTCKNSRCIKNLKASFSSRSAISSQATGNLICNAVQGGTMLVSEIIYRAQVACGISAKVILVMLQKEQGLVLSSEPTEWNVTAAMGASCPDTAPCDPTFAGIGPQIMKGAQQLKTYKAANFAKQPGVHYIAYSPKASCGGTNLNIRNFATAALYNYTPYQPNAAAIAAGTGEGDGCSSHGNRNFYHFYTEWFGSSQTALQALVRTRASEAVYLIDGASRRQVVEYEDWVQLNAAMGPTAFVSQSYLDGFSDAGKATAVLRNPETGSMSLIQDGKRYGFSSCAQVAQWGASCDSPANVSPARYQGIPEGPLLTDFFIVNGSSRWGAFTAPATVQPYYDASAAIAGSGGGSSPFAARLPAWRWQQLKKLDLRFAPGQLVRAQSKDAVFLTDGWSRLIWVADFGDARQYGRTDRDLLWVSDAELSAYHWNGADQLLPFATCAGKPYFAAGQLHEQDGAGPSTLTTTLDDLTCKTLGFGQPSRGGLFVAESGSERVYLLRDEIARPVGTWSAAVQVNVGQTPVVLFATSKTLSRFTIGSAVFLEPSLIRSRDRNNVFLAMGDQRVGLPSFGLARDLGVSTDVSWHSQAEVDSIRAITPELTSWVACDGFPYVAAGGVIHRVSAEGSKGFTPTPLAASTCAQLKKDDEPLQSVFIKGAGASVLLAQDGRYRPLATWGALLSAAGGSAPRILVVDDAVFATLPRGSAIS